MMTRRSTARMAARLRSVFHDSHASRAVPMGDVAHHRGRSCEPVIFPPRGADGVLGALPDVQPVGPVDYPAGVVAACLFARFLGVPYLFQQLRAAWRVLES